MGVITVQGGANPVSALLISLPLGFLAAVIVIINEFSDFKADKQTGKNNLIVRLGVKNGRYTYFFMSATAYFFIIAVVLLKAAHPAMLAVLAAAPLSVKATVLLRENYEKTEKLASACGMTILAHLITGIIMLIVMIFFKHEPGSLVLNGNR